MGELKSAYELAMEKLRRAEGAEAEPRALTTEQKERIAAIRKELKAKLAEREIMLEAKLAKLHERTRPEDLEEERLELEKEHAAERRRLEEECDRRCREVREA